MAKSQLTDLLGACTVRFLKPLQGTGFFVAPGRLLTCAHVVGSVNSTQLGFRWREKEYTATVRASVGIPNWPDLAVVHVDETDHPCVLLHPAGQPGDALYIFGYSDQYPDGDSATTEHEGSSTKGGVTLLKMKSGQIRPGMSGAPVLNRRTGMVCGMVSVTRERSTDLGGRAVPVSEIIRAIPEMAWLNSETHARAPQWLMAMSSAQLGPLFEASLNVQRRYGFSGTRALTAALLANIERHGGLPRSEPFGAWRLCGPRAGFGRSMTYDAHAKVLLIGLQQGQGLYRSEDNGGSWTAANIGLESFEVNAMVSSPHDGRILAGTDRGIWQSEDSGLTWTNPISRFARSEIQCIAFAPDAPEFLLVGTLKQGGTSFGAATVAGAASGHVGAGHLHFSVDAGRSWQTLGLETINGAAVSSSDSRVVYLASADGGLFRTTDRFASLQRVASFSGRPLAVALSALDPNIVAVGARDGLHMSFDDGKSWQPVQATAGREVNRVSLSPNGDGQATSNAGFFESTDSGRTWTDATGALPYRFCMASAGGHSGEAFVLTSGGGVFRRGQRNGAWKGRNDGLPPAPVSRLAFGTDGIMFVASLGIHRSLDHGTSWEALVSPGPVPVGGICVSVDPTHATGSAGSGLHISGDHAVTFSQAHVAPAGSITVFVPVDGSVFRSDDAGETWKLCFEDKDARVRFLWSDPDDSTRIWLLLEPDWRANAARLMPQVHATGDGGRSWSRVDSLAGFVCNSMLFDRSGSDLFAGTSEKGVLRSTDGGQSWSVCDGCEGATITGLASSHAVAGRIWACSEHGSVYRSDDRGEHFQQVRSESHPESRWSTLIATGTSTDTVYLGTRTGIWRGTDDGVTWERVTPNTPDGHWYVNQLAERGARVYAATVQGLFCLDP